MTELIGDICEPSELRVPKREDDLSATISEGALFLSGTKLWFHDGTQSVVVTSS